MGLFNALKYDMWYETKLGKQVLQSELSAIEQIIVLTRTVPRKYCKVIDVGCGTGRFGAYFKKFNCDVYCLDTDSNMLKIAEKRGLKTINADARKIPFSNNFFDIVISITALEFMSDYRIALKEMIRVAKDNGIIIFGVLNKWSIWAIYRIIKSKFWRKVNFFTPTQVKAITGKEILGAVIFPPFYTPVNLFLDSILKKTPLKKMGAIIFGYIKK
ncbi:MAG: class I SAM-dependent methyltransferase [Candidatus Asgardarchaeia archaeon]